MNKRELDDVEYRLAGENAENCRHASILYLVGDYGRLTETFIRNEVDFMRTTDIGVEVCSLSNVPPRISESVHFLRSRLLRDIYRPLVGDSFGPTRKTVISALLRACRIAQQGLNATHVHAHFLGMPAIVAYCLSRLTGVTYSLTAHAWDIYVAATPRVVIERAVTRFTCTEAGKRFLESKYGLAFELVRHGMDVARFNDRPRRSGKPPCRLLAVGRLVEKKGFECLIEACHILSRGGFPFVCTIIGDGPRRSAIEKQVKSCGLEENVCLPGSMRHEDVLRNLVDADIFVAPSIVARNGDRDGVPNTVLEAMASHVPVIATDAGGIPEAIRNGVNGLCVAQKRPDEIAQACTWLWENPDAAEKLAAEARKTVERDFDCAFWNRRLLGAFRERLAGGEGA